MKSQNLIIPGAIVTVGAIILFVPDLDSSSRMIGFCVALLCATVAAIISGRSNGMDAGVQFKVNLKEISFVHFERSRNDRPQTMPEVTAVYDEAVEHFHNGRYESAAPFINAPLNSVVNIGPPRLTKVCVISHWGSSIPRLRPTTASSFAVRFPDSAAKRLATADTFL